MSQPRKRRASAKSAGELMAELQKDPAFLERQSQRENEIQQHLENYGASAAGVLADLAAVGFDVQSIGDLRRLNTPYHDAVPVLMHWLPRIRNDAVREDIIRTLSVPWATDAAPLLVTEFEQADDTSGTGFRWLVANALEVLANDDIAEHLIRMATESRFGKAREMIVLGLAKLKDPRVPSVLTELLSDVDVVGHAVIALGKLRVNTARSHIEPLLHHPQPWVRREAKRALANIDKTRRPRNQT